MVRKGLLGFVLVNFFTHVAISASAVAVNSLGQVAIVGGASYTQESAKQKAMDLLKKYGRNPRIVASSAVVGDCAVAFWRNGNHWAVGASLGKRSSTEADDLAMKYCLKYCPSSANPKIIRGFRA